MDKKNVKVVRDHLINTASRGKYKNTEALVKAERDFEVSFVPSQNNQLLNNIDNKLVDMMVEDTFEYSTFNKFLFFPKRKINLGAFLQTVGIGLGTGATDKIPQTNDGRIDLLPNLAERNQYTNYVKTFLINFNRKYEVLTSDAVYRFAFTTTSGFGDFVGLWKSRGVATAEKEVFETSYQVLSQATRNVVTLPTYTVASESDYAESLRDMFERITDDLATHVPYSNTMNLGLAQGETTFPQNTAGDISRNTSGLDYSNIPAKVNTLNVENVNGVLKYKDLNVALSPILFNLFTKKVLGDIYHNEYNKMENAFSGIALLPPVVTGYIGDSGPYPTATFYSYNETTKTHSFEILVFDKKAMIMGDNINVVTTQTWAGGTGGYLIQNQLKLWMTLAPIPFMNAKKYLVSFIDNRTQ